jgi:2,3-bisphosphoglycerate-dependent phosphoglycerate mutase
MTTVYFIRHAESDFSIKDDRTRPLTAKGSADCALVTEFLQNKKIDAILSSPYKRAVDTITGFAESVELPIHKVEDFREREHIWIDDWLPNAEKQWADFSYKIPGDESLAEVQKRNIAALKSVLRQYKNKNIVIGTHGLALSTIINFYDKSYGFDEFMKMVFITPWVVIMDFDENGCIGMKKVDLFKP